MNYSGFLDAVRNLNENSYFFGNEVLYKMAEFSKLRDPAQLAGSMWLIGRSYAASPQRRSYGIAQSGNWPVRSDNDGREQFFSFIARNIQLPPLLCKDRKFAFDELEEDLILLQDSIDFVLQFNLALSRAIEAFDYADDRTYCTNHISFCSKFLHFYYPHSVFIVDNYAQTGATRLFGKSRKDNWSYICNPMCEDTYNPLVVRANRERYCFESDIYRVFAEKQVEKRLDFILETPKIQEIFKQYELRKPEHAKSYVSHCLYSYIFGCMLQKAGITPSTRLAGEEHCSMPRLVDTVFLNIKGRLTKAELDRYQDLCNRYGDCCKEYAEYREFLK